jgi:hypothetical protein
LRIWANNNGGPAKNVQKPQGQAPKQVTGRVIEVNSLCMFPVYNLFVCLFVFFYILATITVRYQDNNNTSETKFHFSSIRAPRPPLREAPKVLHFVFHHLWIWFRFLFWNLIGVGICGIGFGFGFGFDFGFGFFFFFFFFVFKWNLVFV